MNKYIVIILLMVVAGCKSRSIHSTTKSDKDRYAQENFDQFFEKFKSDSVFQLERIKFPLTITLTHEEGDTVEALKQADWKSNTFYYEKEFASRPVDAYTQQLTLEDDKAVVEQRGVDNGLQFDYTFAKHKGKWFLVSGKDSSD